MAEKQKAKSSARGSPTGLTESEALEIHQWFVRGFMGFVAFAIVAHLLVYMWRPWLP